MAQSQVDSTCQPPDLPPDQCDQSPDMPLKEFDLTRWLVSKEIGFSSKRHSRRNEKDIWPLLYRNMKKCNAFQPSKTVKDTSHGGIFNFDFSTDGSLLVAACERKSFLLFDPLNGKLLQTKLNAHTDCVNCVRFLDTRTFATCSDDTTVTLWDSRFLKSCVRTLKGHSNWVKNIEYDRSRGLLLTSGFDGCVYSWDINRYTETETEGNRVFYTNSLMRCKLSPDASKLVISTLGGYIMIIHDLDVDTLSRDLSGFKPNLYRLMQMAQTPIRNTSTYNHVFRNKRNRVEFITDFPKGNDAEVLSSIQIHPQGWCVASRNTSSDENSEWTCLHDIQSYPAEEPVGEETEFQDIDPGDTSDSDAHSPYRLFYRVFPGFFLHQQKLARSYICVSGLDSRNDRRLEQYLKRDFIESAFRPFRTPSPSSPPSPSRWSERSLPVSSPELSPLRSSASNHPPEDLAGSSEVDRLRSLAEQDQLPQYRDTSSVAPAAVAPEEPELVPSILLPDGQLLALDYTRRDVRIYQNRARLLYYNEEPNVGRGFIKEMCFSQDGRVVCSPFAYGTRLLVMDETCAELCDLQPKKAWPFIELCASMSHQNVVLSTKFSPTHCLYVSGCLSGEVVFHQPVF